MLVKTTTLLAAASALASANPVPLAYPNTLATRLECTGPPSITLRAGEWTRVEGLEGDQGGFGGPSAAWRLSIARGAYSEERFTLVTYKVGSGDWSDAVAAKDGLQEDKRFDCSITAPHGVDSSNGCGVFTVTYTFPIVPTYLNGGIEAVCTRM